MTSTLVFLFCFLFVGGVTCRGVVCRTWGRRQTLLSFVAVRTYFLQSMVRTHFDHMNVYIMHYADRLPLKVDELKTF